MERLQKLIAAAGICSRRQAEDMLRLGRVRLNGEIAHLGDRGDPAADLITLDGAPLAERPEFLTILLNKPAGVLCTCHDPQARTTVLDLLPPDLRQGGGLHPVGRLDAPSRGALLITNDGDLTLRLTHPRFGHRKTYRVWVRGRPGPTTLRRWRDGPPLDGLPSRPVDIRELRHVRHATHLELTLREGRNRQIRRTAAALGHPVLDLMRVGIGSLTLADLPEGHWRPLSPSECRTLVESP